MPNTKELLHQALTDFINDDKDKASASLSQVLNIKMSEIINSHKMEMECESTTQDD